MVVAQDGTRLSLTASWLSNPSPCRGWLPAVQLVHLKRLVSFEIYMSFA